MEAIFMSSGDPTARQEIPASGSLMITASSCLAKGAGRARGNLLRRSSRGCPMYASPATPVCITIVRVAFCSMVFPGSGPAGRGAVEAGARPLDRRIRAKRNGDAGFNMGGDYSTVHRASRPAGAFDPRRLGLECAPNAVGPRMARERTFTAERAFARQARAFARSPLQRDSQRLHRLVALAEPRAGEKALDVACGP